MTINTPSAFGQSKAGPAFRFRNFYLKSGEPFTARLFPSMHSLRDRPDGWKKYLRLHRGYHSIDPGDKTKKRWRKFRCIEVRNFKTKMTEVPCPECSDIDRLMQEHQDYAAAEINKMRLKGILDKDVQQAQLKQDPEWNKYEWPDFDRRVDSKWHINVLDAKTGEFGPLEIPGRMLKALEAKIKDLSEKFGIDAFDLNSGVWFTFLTSGRGGNTTHTVEVVMELDPSRPGSMTIKPAPLTQAQADLAATNLPDLADIGRILTHDQIVALVESGGDPDVVETVFSMTQGNSQPGKPAPPPSSPPADDDYEDDAPAAPPAVAAALAAAAPKPQVLLYPTPGTATQPLSVINTVVGGPQPEPEDEIAAMERKLAEAKAKKAASLAKAAVPPAPQPQVGLDPNMSPEQFASLFPAPNRGVPAGRP